MLERILEQLSVKQGLTIAEIGAIINILRQTTEKGQL
jgi:hypothetical protein